MITLRIIFYGLVAFVPSIDQEGMMVLLLDPATTEEHGGHSIPSHHVEAFRVLKSATGEPYLEAHEGLTELLSAGTYFEPSAFYTDPLTAATSLREMATGGRRTLPFSNDIVADFSWSPEVEAIAPEAGAVRAECLVNPGECGLFAAFRIWAARARTCHLAHPRLRELEEVTKTATSRTRGSVATEDDHGRGPLGPIIAYRFRAVDDPPSATDVVQAVADAVVVEIDLPKEEAELYYARFDNTANGYLRFGSGTASDRTVTLLIANIGERHSDLDPADLRHLLLGSDHYRAYYSFSHTAFEAITQRIPHPTFEVDQRTDPRKMECEAEISLLETYVEGENEQRGNRLFVNPHLLEVCATTTFQAARLPSTRALVPQPSLPTAVTTGAGAAATPRTAPRAARRLSGNQGSIQPPP